MQHFKVFYENLSQKIKWMEFQMIAGGFQMMPASMGPDVGSGKAFHNPPTVPKYATPHPDFNV